MYTFKYILLLILLLSFSVCTDKSKDEEFNKLLGTATVELSEIEICAVKAYFDRGLEGDKCMVDCIIHGKGDNNLGGCSHKCFAYGRHESKELPELQKCLSKETE